LQPIISPTALVEPLKGHGFEAAIDGSIITIPSYGAFFGEMRRD
jgi:hypothetical protein